MVSLPQQSQVDTQIASHVEQNCSYQPFLYIYRMLILLVLFLQSSHLCLDYKFELLVQSIVSTNHLCELTTLDAKVLKTHLVVMGVPAVANLQQYVNSLDKQEQNTFQRPILVCSKLSQNYTFQNRYYHRTIQICTYYHRTLVDELKCLLFFLYFCVF